MSAQPYCLEHALAYVRHGLSVLPLVPGGKAPATGLAPHGFKNASTNLDEVRRWYEESPECGVGIYTGRTSLLVLDVDDKPGRVSGADSLRALEAVHGELPQTLTQYTPTGNGRHLFFRLPPDVSVGNSTLAPGIDVRHAAGYVAAEPTAIDGKSYTFDDWDIAAGEPLPEVAHAPAWVLELLAVGQKQAASSAPASAVANSSPREYVTPGQVTELRSALNALPADDYETWVAVGHALRGLGDVGRELWLTWSQQSPKWKPTDAQKWDGFASDNTSFRAVFTRAQAVGWVNPMSKAATMAAPAPTPPASIHAQGGVAPSSQLQLVQPAAPPTFMLVPFADMPFDPPPPPPEFWWDGYLPARATALWSAHGGTGKTTMAMMLMVSIALGVPLFGVATKPGRVVFFSGEDSRHVVLQRLHLICKTMGVSPQQLDGRIYICDATDGNPVLYGEAGRGPGRVASTTPTYTQLAGLINSQLIDVVIIDNASDAFDANEIDRARVREFVRSLSSLVSARGGAVLLLAHVDKLTSRATNGQDKGAMNSEGYSGSTAWNNSVRSRLFMSRDKAGQITIAHQKSNFGRLRSDLILKWPLDGLPEVAASANGAAGNPAQLLLDDLHMKSIVKLVGEFASRGEPVSTATTSRTHAGKVLRREPGFPNTLRDDEVFHLLRLAERENWLTRREHRGASRHGKEVWRLTTVGTMAVNVDPAWAVSGSVESEPGVNHGPPAEPDVHTDGEPGDILALTALTALTSEVDAVDAVSAEATSAAALTALTSAPRGVGGMRAQKSARKVARKASARRRRAAAVSTEESDK